MTHTRECKWDDNAASKCTCGFLVLTKAYRFGNGNIIAFDQFGQQYPYYQDAWARDPDAAGRIKQDYPHIRINAGEVVR